MTADTLHVLAIMSIWALAIVTIVVAAHLGIRRGERR